jgi:membrane protease YdiL (CAAX protease family)
LNWSNPKIVLWQAVVFWLSHTEYIITQPFWFWILVPLSGVILGILTWRFKSITPSTLAHILINVLWSLVAL